MVETAQLQVRVRLTHVKRLIIFVLAMALGLPALASDGIPEEGDTRQSFTIAFTGDVLIHSSVWRSAQGHGRPYNFRPMFRPTRHLIAGADLAICHLESPVDPDSRNLSGFPRFNAPREVVDALVYAGFDGCTVASNHSNDQGPEGIIRTLAVLEDAGLKHAGMRPEPNTGMIAYYSVAGAVVANISATYGLNGLELPASRRYMVQMIDVPEILAEARTAKETGADLVVVSIHCCVEYLTMPTESQRRLAHTLIGSEDIDLIVTHHSHVVGPIEWVSGKPVIHGLGNFLSNQSARAGLPAHTQDGVIAKVTAKRDPTGAWHFVDVGVIPTWVDDPSNGHVIRIASAGTVHYERTMRAINMMGEDPGIFELAPLPTRLLGRLD